MRRLRYNVAMSLDGFIAGPNGEYDWITMDPTIDFGALFSEFDQFLMGRKTFESLRAQGRNNPTLAPRPLTWRRAALPLRRSRPVN
jgi:dihydrofolate reductase